MRIVLWVDPFIQRYERNNLKRAMADRGLPIQLEYMPVYDHARGYVKNHDVATVILEPEQLYPAPGNHKPQIESLVARQMAQIADLVAGVKEKGVPLLINSVLNGPMLAEVYALRQGGYQARVYKHDPRDTFPSIDRATPQKRSKDVLADQLEAILRKTQPYSSR